MIAYAADGAGGRRDPRLAKSATVGRGLIKTCLCFLGCAWLGPSRAPGSETSGVATVGDVAVPSQMEQSVEVDSALLQLGRSGRLRPRLMSRGGGLARRSSR